MVDRFGFEDHNPPPLPFLSQFCQEAAAFLLADTRHVAVVHCKAGKVTPTAIGYTHMQRAVCIFKHVAQILTRYDRPRSKVNVVQTLQRNCVDSCVAPPLSPAKPYMYI